MADNSTQSTQLTDARPRFRAQDPSDPEMRSPFAGMRRFSTEQRDSTALHERLQIFYLIIIPFFGSFLLLAIYRLAIVSFPGYDPTVALICNAVAVIMAILAYGIVRGAEPSPRRLQTGQWMAVVLLVLYCSWFTLEKFFDNQDGVLGRFLTEHPIFAGIAFSFAWFALMIAYGTFLPNTWKRLSLQVSFFVVTPIGLCLLAPMLDARLHGVLGIGFYQAMLTVLLAGSAMVIYGCYHENRLRQDVIEARRLGPYRLKEKLGEGGMGVVYRAEHQLVKRPCAIKFIHPSALADPDQRQRFFREFQALARLSHWNFVEVFDYGVTPDGICYYVMECLEGVSLEQLVRQHGPLPAGRVLYLLRQVCDALRMAHRLGLVHRDLKPSNLFLTSKGGLHDVVKVLDFGLVHDSEHALGGGTLTQQGAIMGTPGYMPPEQAEGARHVDPRSDIYSLGAVGYFLLTGHPPYQGKSVAEILVAQLMSDPPSLARVQPSTPADVIALIDRCLERDPDRRFPTVDAVMEALDSCACATEWTARQAEAWQQTQGTTTPAGQTLTLPGPHAGTLPN